MKLTLIIFLTFCSRILFSQHFEHHIPHTKICKGNFITTWSSEKGFSLVSYFFANQTITSNFSVNRKETGDKWHHAPCFETPYTPSDYVHSGFDKGHFIPFKLLSFDPEAAFESFEYQNQSPQLARFNRQSWKYSEMKILDQIENHGDCAIICGAIYDKDSISIGKHEIQVPDFYFKICYFTKVGMVAILGDNLTAEIKYVTVDEIEHIFSEKMNIKADFFCNLDVHLQEKLESKNVEIEIIKPEKKSEDD